MIGIIGILLLVAGICYSCAYKVEDPKSELVTSLTGGDNQAIKDHPITKDQPVTQDHQTSDDKLPSEKKEASNMDSEENIELISDIYVHLCGAVKQPGVYQVPAKSRVIDLIKQAGGLAKEAAGDYINQAQQVTDGQRIYIPTKDEVKEMSAATELFMDEGNKDTTSSSKKLININLADANELMELPGIGEAKAASIIEYRTANGSFQTIEELMKIPGIKEGLFNKVSSFVSVK